MAQVLATRSGPGRITFVTNPDDCNLACRMCREHSPLAPRRPHPPRRLSLDLVRRVLEGAGAGSLAEVIPSTKGEPLLWTGLEALARLCATRGFLLNVTTNGTFPRLGPAAWAERLAPVTSDLKVSWNAAAEETAAKLMGGLSLARATADLCAFLEVRDRLRRAGGPACRVTFQVTAQEENVGELPGIVRLAAALGVERVKVNQLQVCFPELASDDLRRDAASRARWNAAVEAMREAAGRHRLASGARVLLQNVEPWSEVGAASTAGPTQGPCPFLGREAWVTVEGRLAPCPAPAGQEGRLGDLGSLHERTLADLWSAPAYRALVEGYEAHAACRACPFRRTGGF